MKLLVGLIVPKAEKEGSVFFDGKPVRERHGDIAFISEEGSYFKDLTPKEFGEFLADFYPKFYERYYDKLLHFFQLEEKPIKNMSKGQKAKAEVAAGMAKRTRYLMMDELREQGQSLAGRMKEVTGYKEGGFIDLLE